MRRLDESRGMTLTEIAIALAMIGILSAIAYPSIRGLMPRFRLEGATRELASELSLARLRSVARNREVRLVVDFSGESVTLQEGNAATGSTTWTTLYSRGGADRWSGVDVYLPVSETLNGSAFSYGPEGTITNAGLSSVSRVYLRAGGAPERRLAVAVGTGRITVERLVNGVWKDERKLKG